MRALHDAALSADERAVLDRFVAMLRERLGEKLHPAAKAESLPEVAWSFSIHVHDPAWLAGRRAIRSFCILEVERDHVDLLATLS